MTQNNWKISKTLDDMDYEEIDGIKMFKIIANLHIILTIFNKTRPENKSSGLCITPILCLKVQCPVQGLCLKELHLIDKLLRNILEGAGCCCKSINGGVKFLHGS